MSDHKNFELVLEDEAGKVLYLWEKQSVTWKEKWAKYLLKEILRKALQS